MPHGNEKVIIVDENDEIIDYKLRKDVKKSNIYRVSALWIKNSKGEILLAQRSLNKSHNPGQWGPAVAGTNDEGETYESNIIKEAEEEIGLVNIDIKKSKKVRRVGRLEGYNYFCQWFIAVVDRNINELKIQEDEVQQIRWFERSDLEKISKTKTKDYFSQLEFCLKNL